MMIALDQWQYGTDDHTISSSHGYNGSASLKEEQKRKVKIRTKQFYNVINVVLHAIYNKIMYLRA
jgi:hypothetical protein